MTAPVEELVGRMRALLDELDVDGDPGRFFLGTYLRTTEAVDAAIDGGLFEDPAWVTVWDVDFAEFYLDALEAHRRDPASPPAPWRAAFGTDPRTRPEGHVLLGMNAHINFDLPQSLVRVIGPADFADPAVLDSRRRDHERIDAVLAGRVAHEDVALQAAGSRRTVVDRVMVGANRTAARVLLRESRRRVWANTTALHEARLAGPEALARRVAQLEEVSAARVADLRRGGPVLLRLAVSGFGVELPQH
ncbi:hypothetical protein SAMN05660464_3094 [Geodermatophilus dictyosporus]|uniref:Uncharacterized protein n=1 Tax=Geodermatophilus dictyosporus TaxID=1523247 RepID=A0A1I5Q241_9ACTN|nr:DUF5995 family protein [Geodermatophilus dictyosporus]SFP40267.1 hypothetical protein SAMN05660464_3094 [Geodermatophilus dictyosporus]